MLVTIYIPTKDRVDTLACAVESVLAQSHQDFELIVVNDGSSDGTAAYLADLASKDSRVRGINREKPGGAPAARNMAIREARGYFVTGLDDDDLFEPGRLESFVAYWDLLKKNGVHPACLYSQDHIIEGVDRVRVTKKPGHVQYEDLFAHNCLGNQIFAPRESLLKAGLFDEALLAWQDLEFFMRVLKNFGTAHLLDMPTYRFDDSPRSDRISHKSRKKIDSAFTLVASKHAVQGGRARQKLFLQIFSPYYGFRPGFRDWFRFMSDGVWAVGFLRLLRSTFR